MDKLETEKIEKMSKYLKSIDDNPLSDVFLNCLSVGADMDTTAAECMKVFVDQFVDILEKSTLHYTWYSLNHANNLYSIIMCGNEEYTYQQLETIIKQHKERMQPIPGAKEHV